jgi:hypothetical protein
MALPRVAQRGDARACPPARGHHGGCEGVE